MWNVNGLDRVFWFYILKTFTKMIFSTQSFWSISISSDLFFEMCFKYILIFSATLLFVVIKENLFWPAIGFHYCNFNIFVLSFFPPQSSQLNRFCVLHIPHILMGLTELRLQILVVRFWSLMKFGKNRLIVFILYSHDNGIRENNLEFQLLQFSFLF